RDITGSTTPPAANLQNNFASDVCLRSQVMVHLHWILLDRRIVRKGDRFFVRVWNISVVHELPVFGRNTLGQNFVGDFCIQAFEPRESLEGLNNQSYHRILKGRIKKAMRINFFTVVSSKISYRFDLNHTL